MGNIFTLNVFNCYIIIINSLDIENITHHCIAYVKFN